MMGVITSIASFLLLIVIWRWKKEDGSYLFTRVFKWFATLFAGLMVVGGVYFNQVMAILGFGFLAYKVLNAVLTAIAAWPYLKRCRKWILEESTTASKDKADAME